MPTSRTPGVYVEELPADLKAVAEVPTDLPAFVGFTEKACRAAAGDLTLVPTRVQSFTEFEALFGRPRADRIEATVSQAGSPPQLQVALSALQPTYLLHWALRLYFDNGGGPCLVVSVGGYADALAPGAELPPGAERDLAQGLEALRAVEGPTLLVIPEAIRLGEARYPALVQAALRQCGELKDRFAILDVPQGRIPSDLRPAREAFGLDHLKWGAAYYPFLKTSFGPFVASDEANVQVTCASLQGGAGTLGAIRQGNADVHAAVRSALAKLRVELPPSAALAGLYVATDRERGVWKAPANVAVASVVGPVQALTSRENADMNVESGKGRSINALRAFQGRGTLVWGARTLAGNDDEWRYVPVRRLLIQVEQALLKGTAQLVFEPNDAGTWVKTRRLIEDYLAAKWRAGALAGAKPQEAFFVRIGLGVTMSDQDLLEGRMIFEVGLAVARPAEFIILRLAHRRQAA